MGTHGSKTRRARRFGRALSWVAPVAGATVLMVTLLAGGQAAMAGNQGTFPMLFNPETATNFTNTFTNQATLSPECPNGIAGTPGSDPATKVLNTVLNQGATTFAAGSLVHYTYNDDAHTTAFGFTIQDCEVVYPPGFFGTVNPQNNFDPVTGVLTNPAFSKNVLDQGGTMVDGAALSGFSQPNGSIYYSWGPVPSEPAGSWICNFARDIKDNHGGGGNRKVTPTCFQVGGVTPRPTVSVGYADSFRPSESGTNTPSPWECAPSPTGCQAGVVDTNSNDVPVTFVGCDFIGATSPCDGQGFDGGGIMVDNPSSTQSMSVSAASVTIDGPGGNCVYTPWNSPITIPAVPANGSLILSETGSIASGVGSPCGDVTATPHDNFDTSEANDVTNPGGACVLSPTAVVPQISITVSIGGGSPMTYTYSDTNEILNTGGTDIGDCPPGTGGMSEVHDWSPLS